MGPVHRPGARRLHRSQHIPRSVIVILIVIVIVVAPHASNVQPWRVKIGRSRSHPEIRKTWNRPDFLSSRFENSTANCRPVDYAIRLFVGLCIHCSPALSAGLHGSMNGDGPALQKTGRSRSHREIQERTKSMELPDFLSSRFECNTAAVGRPSSVHPIC